MSNTPAILAEGLQKHYGKTQALVGLDLVAEQGSVLGLLGPNGAGKTTAVRILTTLLRPDARRAGVISTLWADGTTVLLTTQYLEEADQLADQIAVVDHGRVIANGTADELKAQVGGERLELTVTRGGDLDAAVQALRPYSSGELQVDADRRHLVVPVTRRAQQLAEVVRDLDAEQIPLDDLALRRPTLDDVFLALTGRAAEEAELPAETAATQP